VVEISETRLLKLALAVDPTTKGFAFVVLEDGSLVDWGVRHAGVSKNSGSVRKLRVLLKRYTPDMLVVEDVNHRSSRRWRRVRQLVAWFSREARHQHIALRRVAHQQVRKHFAAYSPHVTKYGVALALAERFPELRERLPRVRKMWMTEDERMSIFDALAMALVATSVKTDEASSSQAALA